MEREIKLAEVAEDLIVTDDVMYEDGYLNFEYEMWFEHDKYFGTNVREQDGWVNFYTDWYPDGSINAWYTVNTPDESSEEKVWILLPEEERILRTKMEMKAEELGFKSLAHMWVEDWE